MDDPADRLPVFSSMLDLGALTSVPEVNPALQAFSARPVGNGPWPGVVLVHEAFGLNEVTKRQAVHLASRGYVVLAPDLFAAGGMVRCLVATLRQVRAGHGPAFHDIEAAREHLLADRDATDRIGIIGFCMGGGFALLLAARGYDASAPCYGPLPETPEVLRGACPIVASYGGADRALAGAADKLERALSAYGVPHDVVEYPGARHSFMNDEDPLPAVFSPLFRVAGVGPRPEAAADAWTRIDAFFTEHLG